MRRCFPILVLALLLAACGDRQARAPFTDGRLPPGLAQPDWPPQGWTWGLIQIAGDPPQRYGVGAAPTVPRAEILILPGYGDFAENHFAEAGALIARGDTVWTLDGAGQGGSGRSAEPRDLGHVASFDGDQRALAETTHKVIRPGPDTPLIVIAEGTVATLALRSLQLGQSSPAGLILIDPALKPPVAVDADQAHWAARLLIGGIRAPGARPWTRNEPAKTPRDQRRLAWQVANPDLRMGGPSLGWLAAFDDLIDQVRASGWSGMKAPVLLLSTGGGDAQADERLCRALPRCTQKSVASPRDQADAEAAFIQALMPPNPLPPLTAAAFADEDRSSMASDPPK